MNRIDIVVDRCGDVGSKNISNDAITVNPLLYDDNRNPFSSTIQYRQIVGLIASSSISSIRHRRHYCPTSTALSTKKMDRSNNSCNETINKTYTSNNDDNTAKTIISTSDGMGDDGNTIDSESDNFVRMINDCDDDDRMNDIRVRTSNPPVLALDVIDYMFHNRLVCGNSKKKPQQQLQKASRNIHSTLSSSRKTPSITSTFTIQQHHPGYIPAQLYYQYYNCRKQQQCFQEEVTDKYDEHNKVILQQQQQQQPVQQQRLLVQYFPVCLDCGGILQPGMLNTTIRLVEASGRNNRTHQTLLSQTDSQQNVEDDMDKNKTIITEIVDPSSHLSSSQRHTKRRREARRKAKLYQKQHMGMKQLIQHHSTFTSSGTNINNKNVTFSHHHQQQQQVQGQVQPQYPNSKSKLWQFLWQQQNKYYNRNKTTTSKILASSSSSSLLKMEHEKRIYPFLNCSSNYYIITCGACGALSYLPDTMNNLTSRKQQQQQQQQKLNQVQRNTPKRTSIHALATTKSTSTTSLQLCRPMSDLENESSETIIGNMSPSVATVTTMTAPAVSVTLNDTISSSNEQPLSGSNTATSSTGNNTSKRKRNDDTTTVANVDHNDTSSKIMNIRTSLFNANDHSKKKKKKKKMNCGNDLTSFLSSLNDR